MFRHLLSLFRPRVVRRVVVLNAAPPRVDLDPHAREALRKWLADPVTNLALALVEQKQPGVFIAGSGTAVRSAFDAQAVNNRFHQIQGWVAYRDSLLTVADDVKPAEEPEEDFILNPTE